EISASRKFSKGIVGAGVTCEHDHAVRCIEAIGIRFVLARGWVLIESKMGVFDGCHLYVGVLKNHSSAGIMAEEQLIYRYCAASVGDPDLSTNGEILHRSLDQVFRLGRAIDIDWLGPLVIPRDRHQRTQARRVIVVMVGDENRSDISDVETSLRNTARDAVASVRDI